MNGDLVNRIVASGAFKPAAPARDGWYFGTCDSNAGGVAEVIVDNDPGDAPVPMADACGCSAGDRVVCLLLGASWVVMAWIEPIA